jgi:hypothetical protein
MHNSHAALQGTHGTRILPAEKPPELSPPAHTRAEQPAPQTPDSNCDDFTLSALVFLVTISTEISYLPESSVIIENTNTSENTVYK